MVKQKLNSAESYIESPLKLYLFSLSLSIPILGILFLTCALAGAPQAALAGAPQFGAPQFEAPKFGAVFTVNSSADIDLKNSELTLREAILVSNGELLGEFSDGEKSQMNGCIFDGTADNWMIIGSCGLGFPETIVFSSTLTTVTLAASPLPVIKDDYTVISGTNGLPNIDAGNRVLSSTLVISANSVSIRGLSIFNSPVIHADILISHGKQAEIAFNRLGLKSTGACEDISRYGGFGIRVNTPDGGYDLGDEAAFIYGNTIGCHDSDGILVEGSDQVLIGIKPDQTEFPNWIGLDADNLSLLNGDSGIRVKSSGVEVSELTGIYSNKIGNNLQHGVWLEGALAVDLVRNTVGLDALGLNPAPNGMDGLRITGDVSAEHEIRENTISGNLQNGITVDATDENYFIMNKIGTNVNGSGTVPNTLNGVVLRNGASHNKFGEPPHLNQSQPNPPLPYIQYIQKNLGNGIYIENSYDNYFGESNLIRYNGGAGVVVTGTASTGNMILPMMVYDNGGLPVDLGGDGPTPNDPGDPDSGPNERLNYPAITAINGTVITGTVCTGCEIRVYLKQGNPAQSMGGGTMLGPVFSTGGVWSVDLAMYINQPGLTPWDITMVAWDPDGVYGSTSEMGLQPPSIYLPLLTKP